MDQQHLASLLKELVNSRFWEQSQALLASNPILLSDEADELLHYNLSRSQGDKERLRIIQARRTLLQRCRQHGVNAAFADYAPITEPLLGFINTNTWEEKKEVVERHQNELLSDVAEELLSYLIQQQDDEETVAGLHDCWEVLERCRQNGVEATFAELMRPTGAIISADQLNQTFLQWAAGQLDQANNLMLRNVGDRAENLEEAIQAYNQALTIYTRDQMPEEWAKAQTNLGEAYRLRIRGERADNLEQAIAHFQAALEVSSSEKAVLAQIHLNLGAAYFDRIQGLQSENHTAAIAHFEQVLTLVDPQTAPDVWGRAHLNLGSVYRVILDISELHNRLDHARNHYQQALQVLTRERTPWDWAMAQTGLGHIYSDLPTDEAGENFEEAISHYHDALEVLTRDGYPREWAMTHHNLGVVYKDRVQGTPAENLKMAAEHFQQALEIYTANTFPSDRRQTLRTLGDMQFSRRDWEQALAAYDEVKALDETLLAEAHTVAGREAEANENSQLYPRAAYCLLKLGQLAEALVRLEEGKARLLNEVLALDEHPSSGLKLTDILAVVPPDGALVAPLITAHGSAVWVLPAGQKEVKAEHLLWLDNFNEDDLRELIAGAQGRGWLSSYFAWQSDGPVTDWQATVETLTGKLWELLMGPVHERLSALGLAAGANVVLLPQRLLGLLPLHAAWREVDGLPKSFLDDYIVSYVPSAYTLAVSQRRAADARRDSQSLLLVANPTGDLEFAVIEAHGVGGFFPSTAQQILFGDQATRDAVMRAAAGQAYLHFSCHGIYDWHDAKQSGLMFAGDELFTLSEIASSGTYLSAARLVVLSACETGMSQVFRMLSSNVAVMAGEEYVGLPAGFLQVGAPGVVSSLWPVDDLSTALLMIKFYEYHLQGEGAMAPAKALRRAQLWLRDVTNKEVASLFNVYCESNPAIREIAEEEVRNYAEGDPAERPFASPDYWASFVFYGA